MAAIAVWGVLWVSANLGIAGAMPTRFENGITSDPALLVLFIAICAVLCVLAGWLCATIAKDSLMKHVFVLALIQLAIGILVQASAWDLMPVWYHLTFLALVVPMHLVGGRIRTAHESAVPSTFGAARVAA
jgi:hypothetical protein